MMASSCQFGTLLISLIDSRLNVLSVFTQWHSICMIGRQVVLNGFLNGSRG